MAPRVKIPAARGKEKSPEKGSGKRERGDRRKRDRPAQGSGRKAKGKGRRVDKQRARGKVTKGTQEKVKGWLATPADWKRFNAWAKINAQPKKVPEPEPIVRPSKPISQFKKRLKVLAQPREFVDASVNCRLELSISKAALKAVPSIRTNLLALPVIRLVDYGRIYYQVSPAALTYEPSDRILELSQPRSLLPERCKPPAESLCQPCVDPDRLKALAMKRKLLNCPEQLTAEEIEELFTPQGIRRSALAYKITPWTEFLALPPYKSIKERKDENAVTWKKKIMKEGEKRGKKALVEQRKKRAEERRKQMRLEQLRKKMCDEEEEKKRREQEEEEERKRRSKLCGDQGMPRQQDEEKKERKSEKDKKYEKERKREKKTKKRKGTRDDGDAKKVKQKKTEEKISKEEEERRKKKRKKRENAWRFAPYPCSDDAFYVKKAALEFEASPRTTELSNPRKYKNRTIKANPFSVKKAALSASASGRVEILAKPNRPRSPVEKRPPREKDAYGKPIFIMPAYGKVLPKTKPYKMGECPSEEEEKEKKKKKKKKKVSKKRPIDPIAYEPTYDPCICPELAKKQRRERKRAEKLSPKKKRRRQRSRQASRTAVAKKEDENAGAEETDVTGEEEGQAEPTEPAEPEEADATE